MNTRLETYIFQVYSLRKLLNTQHKCYVLGNIWRNVGATVFWIIIPSSFHCDWWKIYFIFPWQRESKIVAILLHSLLSNFHFYLHFTDVLKWLSKKMFQLMRNFNKIHPISWLKKYMYIYVCVCVLLVTLTHTRQSNVLDQCSNFMLYEWEVTKSHTKSECLIFHLIIYYRVADRWWKMFKYTWSLAAPVDLKFKSSTCCCC